MRWVNFQVILWVAAAVSICGGCAGIKESLRLDKTVLVKVPDTEIHERASAQGWEFRHVLNAPRDPRFRGQWYVAWNPEAPLGPGPWRFFWHRLFQRAPEIADASYAALGTYPVLIEPNHTFGRMVAKTGDEPEERSEIAGTTAGDPRKLVYGKVPSRAWATVRTPDPNNPGRFIIDPVWHLRDEYTQLASARERAGKPRGKPIRIGHLDNGMDGRHAGLPEHLERGNWRANTVGLLAFAQGRQSRPIPPEETGATHGLGTVGILAGGKVTIKEEVIPGGKIAAFSGYLGGAPNAEIVPVRVAPWVFSFTTGELAYAIDYASRVKGCDVITMSHGGAPTQAWVDAVNAAYERGTAMFAAESDFFSLVFNPFPPRGLILPASPVYPAGFRRVIGVTGVTADERSYARNTLSRLLRAPSQIASWVARGSYGADGTSTALLRPSKRPDGSQIKRLGELRPHPIAAYSPNIPWLSIREENGRRIADGVDLDGAGTSASTPQVAAAAALWLQLHREEFTNAEWRSWRKAEAVYYALLKSARRKNGRADKYLGAGILQANDALDLSYHEIQRAKKPENLAWPPPGTLYFGKAPTDYFDGARSAWSFFGIQTSKDLPYDQRALLDQEPRPDATRTDALAQLFFNMFLLREWHGGDLPNNGRHKRLYQRRAKRRAEAVSPPVPRRVPPIRRALTVTSH